MAFSESITVLERGWLSANCILLRGRHGCALVDSGYVTHAGQTVQWLRQAMGGQRLDVLLNTHLHSDHCGGNAAIQHWAGDALHTWIPAGTAHAVAVWDEERLSFAATGQQCAPFGFTHTFASGQRIALGDAEWEIHSAAGHDPDMVMLFEPASRTLLSADALWEQALGVIFPEIEGIDGFGDAAATLDCIERLNPARVIPGHGAGFADVGAALRTARKKLEGFAQNPARHAHYAAKVLVKFKLLEQQRMRVADLQKWAARVPYFERLRWLVHSRAAPETAVWVLELLSDLARADAAQVQADWVANR